MTDSDIMRSMEDFREYAPYALSRGEKERLLGNRLSMLTRHHLAHCPEYQRMLKGIGSRMSDPEADFNNVSYTELPFLPVRLFKELSLKSIPEEEVVKTMISSGTTGQAVSRIYLDRITAANQQKALVKIVSDFTGSSRMPMIIIDCPSVVKDRRMFSARGAGILGFSIFGSKKIYALNDEMQLDMDGIREFLSLHPNERILLFGFTFMVWQHFYKELARFREKGETIDLSGGILIHGGGWKKLASEAVSPKEFQARLKEVCGLSSIHDYYGMVEQTGCIYMECEYGHLHTSIYSDVIPRRAIDFTPCEIGEKGIIQVVSAIPESYPGHSLLTEDEGIIEGIDDCPCGRKGKYFKVLGRLKNAELRGCSDTYGAKFVQNDCLTREEKIPIPLNTDEINSFSAKPYENEILDKVTWLMGDPKLLKLAAEAPARQPFDEEVCVLLEKVSELLRKDKRAKVYPEVITFAFWIRRAGLRQLREKRLPGDNVFRLGRGLVFHIAPGNVPVNFAYSLAAGLLMGNANIVRVPSKDFAQVGIIADAFRETLKLEEFQKLAPYILLMRYDRNKKINDLLSGLSDVRIVWGGDQTIKELRKSPLPPRSIEVTFADRYSIAVIDADAYLEMENKGRIAEDFYNDTYLTDQNACSSPRIVIWTGERKKEAKELFWKLLHTVVEEKYPFRDVQSVNKLTSFFRSAAKNEGIRFIESGDNLITRVEISKLSKELMDERENSGYFLEYDCNTPEELLPVFHDKRCQTVGMLGDRRPLLTLLKQGGKGVDRIVPLGHTMDFDLLWDGYELTHTLTRSIGELA